MAQDYIPNETVTFKGFAEGQDAPDNANLLEVGEQYVVASVEEDKEEEGEFVYSLEVDNPDFDDSKRASKKNAKIVKVEVFGDEIERFEEEEEEEEEKTPAKAKAKSKAKPKAKAKAKAKAPAKKAPAKKKAAAKAKAPAKEKPDPELKNLIILNEDEEDQEILDLVAGADDLIALAQELVEDSNNVEWRLGGVLYHARVGGEFKAYDDGEFDRTGGWQDFCDQVLGLEYRKSQYLLDIYTTFTRFGKGADELNAIGWSKAIQITKHMDEENVDQLIDLAEEQSVRDLQESINTSFKKKTATKQVTKMIRFNFVLEESAAELTKELFEQIKDQMGVETDHQAFEQIISEYAQSNLDVSAIKKAERSARAANKAKSGGTKAKAKAKAKAPAKKKAVSKKRKAA